MTCLAQGLQPAAVGTPHCQQLAKRHRQDCCHHLNSDHLLCRDVKPENILITSKGDLKIIDFGAAVDLCTGINFNPLYGMLDPRYWWVLGLSRPLEGVFADLLNTVLCLLYVELSRSDLGLSTACMPPSWHGAHGRALQRCPAQQLLCLSTSNVGAACSALQCRHLASPTLYSVLLVLRLKKT